MDLRILAYSGLAAPPLVLAGGRIGLPATVRAIGVATVVGAVVVAAGQRRSKQAAAPCEPRTGANVRGPGRR